MSQWGKLLQSIRNNPKSVRFDELDKVLRNTGFERKQCHGNHVKEVYVKQVIEILSQKGWI